MTTDIADAFRVARARIAAGKQRHICFAVGGPGRTQPAGS